MASIVLVLSGPPKAGKSRLRGALYRALLRTEQDLYRRTGRRFRWFVEVLSPDCEGQWVNDAHDRGRGAEAEARARALKARLKATGAFFGPDWLAWGRMVFRNLCRWAEVLVIDLGGIPSPQNAFLVFGDEGRVPAGLAPVVVLNGEGDGGWVAWWRAHGVEPVYVGPCTEGLAEALCARAVATVL